MNDGDWICSDPNCGNINFARRNSCYRCNKERPEAAKPSKKKLGTEIGKSAAEKSRGLFNADDWQCNKCANVNWARRQTCNVCNAPKFGEVEARTGYGGGYNERGVVEYRRREPSSDDEFDEFGRKKRKRQHYSQDKVGITEGAVYKKLPPTMPPKESNLEHVMPVPVQNMSNTVNKDRNVNGSLSDGSVCEHPSLPKTTLSRYYHNQDHMMPFYKTNGAHPRKRFTSVGDRDQTGSSGYETCSKKSKRDSTISPAHKSYHPVMENRVSSTNNDVVYRFAGPTPAEDFQVVYTVEERVRAAAYAIVHNNCKVSTEKFESLFDKPAPDFKTIFAWRQRLLTTGCLVDSHLEVKDVTEKACQAISNNVPLNNDLHRPKPVNKLPNPDEILITSDSDEECSKKTQAQKSLTSSQCRSVSMETVLIGEIDNHATASSVSTEDRHSQARSRSQSSQRRTRSSSRDSQDSNYPDTDSEKAASKTKTSRNILPTKSPILSAMQSNNDSNSDSVSYNSAEDNFLSRVFGDTRKKRKVKRRPVPTVPPKVNNYVANEVLPFEGYSTVKQVEKPPLATGNIYTINLRNMNVKTRDNMLVDTDGCSSEYVPTRLGATAKNNYQDFKNNVRKKGFWAKGNGSAIVRNRRSISSEVTLTSNETITKPVEDFIKIPYPEPIPTYNTTQIKLTERIKPAAHGVDDFTKDDFDNFSTTEHYLPFDKPAKETPPTQMLNIPKTPLSNVAKTPVQNIPKIPVMNIPEIPVQNIPRPPVQIVSRPSVQIIPPPPVQVIPRPPDQIILPPAQKIPQSPIQSIPQSPIQNIPKPPENVDRIFAVVQSSNVSKNRSIMDIFDTSDAAPNSPEEMGELEKYDNVRKIYETEWDEDDDALYKNTDPCETEPSTRRPPSPPSVSSVRAQSPMSNMLYTTEQESQQSSTPKHVAADIFKDKQDMLLGLLKDFQSKDITEMISPLKQMTPQSQSEEIASSNQQVQTNVITNLMVRPEPTPFEMSNEILKLSEEHVSNDHDSISKIVSPLKRVHVLESVTICPPTTQNYEYASEVSPNDENSQETPILQNLEPNPEPHVKPVEPERPAPQFDLSNLLTGINTNTLLLALQNLHQLTQSSDRDKQNEQRDADQNCDEGAQPLETINLTNDEEWENESNRDGSIERQLEKMDGNTGDTPFLSDIFDPGPVLIPPNLAKKLNINIQNPEDNKKNNLNENAPVIGNFKSFALPKPIMLNRLKLTVRTPDKSSKKSTDEKKVRRKKKSKAHASQDGGEGPREDDEEESGDEADLSKYDLWGSDEEQGNSSKAENADKSKDGESSKESECGENNGKAASPEAKNSKRRSRSSSTSSSSSSSSSSSQSSSQAPQNKFDDFNLNSERESSPKGRKSRSRSRSPRSRSSGRRKSRDSRSAGESRSHDGRDKEWSRDRERRDRSRGSREERKERRYSREGANHYTTRGRHR